MRDWDIELLYHFLERPGMYTSETEDRGYKGFDNFLMAYELGSLGECNFRDLLSNQILENSNIPMPSSGLKEQLQKAAQKEGGDWIEMLVKTGKEILIFESDKNEEFKYQRILRNKIRKLSIPEHVDEAMINFFHLQQQVNEWSGVNLDEDEIDQIKLIVESLKRRTNRMTSEVDESTKGKIIKLKEIVNAKHDK